MEREKKIVARRSRPFFLLDPSQVHLLVLLGDQGIIGGLWGLRVRRTQLCVLYAGMRNPSRRGFLALGTEQLKLHVPLD